MNKFLITILLLALATSACVSKSKSNLQAQQAFVAGQQQAIFQQQQQQTPTVVVKGEVKTPMVPWREDLTLSQAIVAAQYTGFLNPKSISITRHGETYPINPKSLLNGADDPLLEAGDVIELRR